MYVHTICIHQKSRKWKTGKSTTLKIVEKQHSRISISVQQTSHLQQSQYVGTVLYNIFEISNYSWKQFYIDKIKEHLLSQKPESMPLNWSFPLEIPHQRYRGLFPNLHDPIKPLMCIPTTSQPKPQGFGKIPSNQQLEAQ